MKFGPRGVLPEIKRPKKIKYASRKFILTHAIRTRDRAHHLLLENESFSFASIAPGSSHFILTNPPIGSQFKVYSVPSLSFAIFFALGGIPIPNSKTFIRVNRAVRKCHISWIKTTTVKTNTVKSIPNKTNIKVKIKNFHKYTEVLMNCKKYVFQMKTNMLILYHLL